MLMSERCHVCEIQSAPIADKEAPTRAENLPHFFCFPSSHISDGSSHIQQASSETKRAGIVTINIFASKVIDHLRA
jgi:hypothetical protein